MYLAPPPIPPKGTGRRNDAISEGPSEISEQNNFSVSAAKAFFEAAKKPEVQRAATAAANNPTVRNTAISAAQNPQTRNQIMGAMAAQQAQQNGAPRLAVPSKNRPNSTASEEAPPPPPHRGASVSAVQPPPPPKKPTSNSIYGYEDAPPAFSSRSSNPHPTPPVPVASTSSAGFSSLVAELQSMQLRSPSGGSGGPPSVNRPTTSSAPVVPKQHIVLPPPPNRPAPVPAATSQYSNQSVARPQRPPPPKAAASPTSYTPTTEPHAVVKYPITATHFDELSCSVGETVILKKEVDEQWIYGMNTSTGSHGIVPLSFLDVKIPLAPIQPSYAASSRDSNGGVALYDYDSQTPGDLRFRAHDHIHLIEWIDAEWLYGECRGQHGILPASYVSSSSLHTLPLRQQAPPSLSPLNVNTVLATMYASYDYNSGVPEDLILRVGDKVEILEYVGTEWVRGRCHMVVGMVPFSFLSSQMKKSPSSLADSITAMARTEQVVTAIDDHQTHDETNLYFSRGDLILIVKEVNEHWYMGKLVEFKSLPAGLVPKNKVV